MERHRRFPLISLLVVLGLAAAVVALASYDPGLPPRALSQVWETVRGLGATLGLAIENPIPEGGLFARQPRDLDDATALALVNYDHPVAEGYAPKGMVRLSAYCDPAVVAIKGDDTEGVQVAVDALMEMLRAAHAQGVGNWQISAGYRSVGEQQRVWDEQAQGYREQGLSEEKAQEATAKYVAQPGHSEHHTGLAFDMTVPGESFPLTQQSKWLAANCWDYGFIIRYTEEKAAVTRINAEPWHIRYVGKAHAQRMRDEGLCLEEYLQAIAR